MLEKAKNTSLRPSQSLRPGISKFVVKGLLDPQFIIVMIVSGIFEGITKAILNWRDKKAEAKEAKERLRLLREEEAKLRAIEKGQLNEVRKIIQKVRRKGK